MNNVKLETVNGKIFVTSPYNPVFPSKAKALGGRWDPSHEAWVFDIRDEECVRALCVKVYGTDGSGSPVDLVTVRHTITSGESGPASLFLYGREIAWRRSRDAEVQLGDKVILIEGRFPGHGGSSKYPSLEGQGTILEVRDVPRSLIEEDDVIVDEIPVVVTPENVTAQQVRDCLTEILSVQSEIVRLNDKGDVGSARVCITERNDKIDTLIRRLFKE